MCAGHYGPQKRTRRKSLPRRESGTIGHGPRSPARPFAVKGVSAPRRPPSWVGCLRATRGLGARLRGRSREHLAIFDRSGCRHRAPGQGSPWRTPVRLPPRVRRTTGTAPDLRCREPAPQLIGHAIPGSGQIHSQRRSGRYWPAVSAQHELDYLHLLKVKPKLRDLSMGHRCAKSNPPKQASMASGRDTWSCHRRRPLIR